MKKARFTEEQIAFALRRAETGTVVTEVNELDPRTELARCPKVPVVFDGRDKRARRDRIDAKDCRQPAGSHHWHDAWRQALDPEHRACSLYRSAGKRLPP